MQSIDRLSHSGSSSPEVDFELIPIGCCRLGYGFDHVSPAPVIARALVQLLVTERL